MAKFINPFTDEGFKRLFGQEEHKTLLIAFLNRLFEDEMTITDISYLDKESIPNHNQGKSYIYDIYCTLDTGEHVRLHSPIFVNAGAAYRRGNFVHREGRNLSIAT